MRTPPLTHVLAVAGGGAAGVVLRAGVSAPLPTVPGRFPWATFAVNVSGAFLLAFGVTVLLARARPLPHARAALGTGLLGGYTTFSAFAVEAVTLGEAARPATAIGYVAATLGFGLLAAAAGLAGATALSVRTTGGHHED